MKSLAEILRDRATSRVLWWPPEGDAITTGSIVAAREAMIIPEWFGKRVALGEMSSLELARSLVLLDGVAESMVFLPLEQDRSAQQQYLADMRIDVVLGDGAAAAAMLTDSAKGKNLLAAFTENHRPEMRTDWILPTSGTTGTPKLIRHTLPSLTRSMSRRDLGTEYVWGSLYHPRRFAGLQVFLQALLSATPLILDDSLEITPDYLSRLSRLGCNALSATPSMWRKFAMCPGFESLPLRQITLGGEIADQPILDLLQRCFPAARVTHIYASTEAGVGFAVRDGIAGFPVSYLSSPPGKVAMRVDGDGSLWFRPHGNSPREIGAADNATDGWIESGDIVNITGERVHFLGRSSGSINVGGNKVMPEEIEAVIKEVQGVAFVVVKGRKNALMGNLVEAHVATTEAVVFDEPFKRAITEHCRNRLDAFKVPAFIKPMDQIELNTVGKINRKEAA
jgi:acyl-CoA synthetase (AMP-forming)/AMP-acid ligase II